MSADLSSRILEDTAGDNREVYNATLAAVANVRRLRPADLKRQPRTARHKMILSILNKPGFEEAAGSLLRGWLLKHQVGLLTDFLDSLGIEHKDGVVDDLPASIPDEKMNAALNALLEKHEREVIIVYLHAFQSMNETGWVNLQDRLDNDDRLQFA
ncbi:MAG: hypothetical protein VX705_07320 [Verrucomicrobiota bacterium]|nr:hypothetical protein [Verrucomicrobiota bacterium]